MFYVQFCVFWRIRIHAWNLTLKSIAVFKRILTDIPFTQDVMEAMARLNASPAYSSIRRSRPGPKPTYYRLKLYLLPNGSDLPKLTKMDPLIETHQSQGYGKCWSSVVLSVLLFVVVVWWIVLRIYAAFRVFQSYRDLEAGVTNLRNHSGVTGNLTSDLLLRKPIA